MSSDLHPDYTCVGQPFGNDICLAFSYQSTCLSAGYCLWNYFSSSCYIYSDCVAASTSSECTQAGSHCTWFSSTSTCAVTSSQTSRDDRWGSCILITDRTACTRQSGCTWEKNRETSTDYTVGIFLLIGLVVAIGVGGFFGWRWCKGRKAAAAAASTTPEESSAVATPVVVPAAAPVVVPAAPGAAQINHHANGAASTTTSFTTTSSMSHLTAVPVPPAVVDPPTMAGHAVTIDPTTGEKIVDL